MSRNHDTIMNFVFRRINRFISHLFHTFEMERVAAIINFSLSSTPQRFETTQEEITRHIFQNRSFGTRSCGSTFLIKAEMLVQFSASFVSALGGWRHPFV